MNNFSSRMDGVQSPIIPIVGQLIRENKGTISLGQGVVYYAPPPAAIEGINHFLSNSHNHQYKSVQGINSLINCIVNKLAEDNQIIVSDDHAILVTAGGNMAFINALLAITNAGDEIILNTPYYFNHEMAITMANCQPILVNTDDNYQLNLKAIEAAITAKIRAVVTISPNNPTGVVYSESSLREVNQLCQEKGIYHISDEAYEYFTYNGVKHFSPASIIGSENHTISLYSLSKAYGFASWRIGYMVMPKHLLDGVKKIQDTILICPPVISQYAALGALNVGKAYCHQYLSEINEVREIFIQSLNKLKDICTIIPADGAFYFFVKVQTKMNDFELVKQLIEKYQIAVLPGGTFGMKEGCYLRIAYGSLQKEIATEGIKRLVKGLRNLVS
ncbi:pyridoxal phosphate-dependent aminotransferase [Crocosphaera sp. UHCC 0190]|uniref:pyridoxal phosphate-dependent aminotransferase n=1 Tax=Crocosphaera sp. UHCC 0190 TaxID=3110246 RepID=UPI002B1EE2E1|nr:pyridoxal phosphate-dependent aminotransferase [Crocosphaera sp. UHCC 0190]MEA5509565.1 pyridoxal phosphate-dependent aminotransferase [Crocosphaera sp. UHCC 0190]